MKYLPITAKVLAYIKEQYASEPEFLWSGSPNTSAIRYRPNGKWFAALMMDIPKSKLKLAGEGCVDTINLK